MEIWRSLQRPLLFKEQWSFQCPEPQPPQPCTRGKVLCRSCMATARPEHCQQQGHCRKHHLSKAPAMWMLGSWRCVSHGAERSLAPYQPRHSLQIPRPRPPSQPDFCYNSPLWGRMSPYSAAPCWHRLCVVGRGSERLPCLPPASRQNYAQSILWKPGNAQLQISRAGDKKRSSQFALVRVAVPLIWKSEHKVQQRKRFAWDFTKFNLFLLKIL
jgi:hypothetical protein